MHRAARKHVLAGVVQARRLGAAGAGVEAGIAQEGKGIREGLRIVQRKRVELQGLLTADGERPEARTAEAGPDHAIEGLTATAAVGIRGLFALWLAAVRGKRLARVHQLPR